MTTIEMQNAFEIELGLIDSDEVLESFKPLHWLNEGILQFVQTRYSGNNVKNQSFEETQKRIDDLRTLVKDVKTDVELNISAVTKANPGVVTVDSLGDLVNGNSVYIKGVVGMTELNGNTYTVANINAGNKTFELSGTNTSTYTTYTSGGDVYRIGALYSNNFFVDLPSDYLFMVNDRVSLSSTTTAVSGQVVGLTTVTENDINVHLDDPFSDHKLSLNTAKPLRIFTENGIELYTDGNYYIDDYFLTYISYPSTISFSIDCDLPTHTHSEIVKIAVQLCLENLKSARQQTHEREVVKAE
jgi:hypothetical protein